MPSNLVQVLLVLGQESVKGDLDAKQHENPGQGNVALELIKVIHLSRGVGRAEAQLNA